MLTEWKLTKRQEDFVSVPDTVFEALGGGAAGGGKTEILLKLPIIRKFYEHPRFKMLYLRRTFPELDNEVIPRSKEFYNPAGFNSYQDQKKRWTHPSGAIIQFGHCEHVKDVYKYDTSEYNLIVFDELTSFTEFQYMYLTMSRCRSADTNLPAFVRSATNPGNIGHAFVRKRFVEPARNGHTIIKEKRDFHGQTVELRRIFIPFKAQDNPYLMKSDPTYLNRLNALPAAERAAKLEGDWWTFSGQVFDDWRETSFPGDMPQLRHVVKPFRIPDYWPRILSIDWGFSALTVAGWYAINPCPNEQYRAKIYKYREYARKKTKISTWANEIASLSAGENLAATVLDPSAWGNRGDEFTIAQQFINESGLRPYKADNDRLGGKLLMQDYIRITPRPARFVPQEGYDPELEMKILRINGEKARDEYLKLFVPEQLELLPKFQVFNNCTGTIEHIPKCVYAADKNRGKTENDEGFTEDVAELRNDTDDFYDETRYGIKACQFYLDGGLSQMRQVEERSKICSRAEQTGNMTQFYMAMDNLEARNAVALRPIKKHHRSQHLRTANWR